MDRVDAILYSHHPASLQSVLTMPGQLSDEPYLADWRQRQVVARSYSLRLAARLRAEVACIATMLRRDFGCTRVLLLGSLAGAE